MLQWRCPLGAARVAEIVGATLCLACVCDGAGGTIYADPPAPPPAAAPFDDGQWRMPAKNFAASRYSELNEITTANVRGLRVAFTFTVGVNRGQEAAPLVVDNTMYVLSPYPNVLFALDLTQADAPVKWKYEPKVAPASQGVACCDVVNRGPAFAEGRVFFNTLDASTVAVDAVTGQELWRTQLGDIKRGETMTMSPLVVKNKVLVGNSGGEFGVRGWIAALDAATGRVVWKAYSTGPDADVLIGPQFAPFYQQDRGKDLGVTTWPGEAWKTGGGSVWGWISYDPDLDLIYHGTANPGPWNPDQRPGDNKWTAGIFARNPHTGEARWFYQWSPHDLYDHDGVNESILLDMEWKGAQRKVLVHPERNGYVYLLDRATGEVLSAASYHPNTISRGVDLATGRLIRNDDKITGTGKQVRDICPAAAGAKDWNPSAYSARTGLLYIPHVNLCMDRQDSETSYIAGTPFLGAKVRMKAGPGGHRGVLTAWDVAAAKPAWSIPEFFPLWSGALATAGDVVFYGTLDGWFKAIHARTGELLWQFRTTSGIVGQPTTYRGPDGHQYVAILSGVGGWAGAIVSADLDARDATAGLGFPNAVRDLPEHTSKGGTLYVFALP
jgi:PQQ-dependent dehydrogenase (methanol/ethanol family)